MIFVHKTEKLQFLLESNNLTRCETNQGNVKNNQHIYDGDIIIFFPKLISLQYTGVTFFVMIDNNFEETKTYPSSVIKYFIFFRMMIFTIFVYLLVFSW